MKTIEKAVQSEINIKKSQFICSLFPTKSKKESKEIIQKLNHQYHDATHNCTAYITNDGEGYDDNGEPGGTAGKPMINALRKNDLHNVTAVVTRYFGGIKLGAGGLIRNYAKTAKLALNESGIVDYIEKSVFILDFDYKNTSEVENFLNINRLKYNIEIKEKNYLNRVTMKIIAYSEIEEKLNEMDNIITIKI